MSKKNRTDSRDRRKKAKVTRRAANNARYAAMTVAGQNQKSKRYRANTHKARKVRTARHKEGICGNTGCSKCMVGLVTWPRVKTAELELRN